ncbi:DUF3373 family protein [Desulfococcaceae bacterium HSG8]|nr:DUF3373 family protein [Desulfococcaceae bacterium HSG8]
MIRKYIIFITIIFFFTAYPIPGEEIPVDKDMLEKILQQQDALEKEIRSLKDRLKKLKDKKTVPAEKSEDMELLKADVEEISDLLDTVETRSILDKIQISGEFHTRMNFYNYDDMEMEDGQKKDGRTDELWSGRLRLNLRSEITDNLIFQGRLTYYKLWGDTNYEGLTGSTDFYHPGTPDQEGDLHVERAYIDYFIPGTPFSVTLGRMPTGNGPPYGLKNNTTRKATWPMLCHDGELDGIMTNLLIDKRTGLKNAFFRLGYYKFSQNYQQYQGVEKDPTRVAIAAFETMVPGIRDSIFWVSYDRAFDMGAFDHPAAASYPSDSGYMDKLNLHIQFNNIKNSGFSCFASYAYERIRPRPEGTIFPPEVTGMPFDYEVGLLGDNLTDSLGKPRNGRAWYMGMNYRLPFKTLKYPRLGFEYNHGSEHWISAPVSGGDEFLNKLTVNGDAYELYYIQPINEKHMFCRIGAVWLDYDSVMNFFGPSTETDMSVMNSYFLINVRF